MADSNSTEVNQIYLHCKDLVNVYPDLCSYDNSFYDYRILLAPNAVFLGFFGASALGYIVVFLMTRFQNVGFNVALLLGVICELLGYLGRVMSWEDQWAENPFMMQISCLTIAPAFLAAGIYFCLRSIVMAFGAENSRISPAMYPRIFIPCDVISLLLQAAGGGLASVAAHNHTDISTGDNTMLAGLAFQVVTLLIFMLLTADFAIRTIRRPSALDHDPALVRLRASWRFRLFLAALALSTICIFIRSVFRVAELSQGWTGPIMKRQDLFIGFEGVMIVISSVILNIFHPNLCFPEMERFRAKASGKEPKGARNSSSGTSSENESKAPSFAR